MDWGEVITLIIVAAYTVGTENPQRTCPSLPEYARNGRDMTTPPSTPLEPMSKAYDPAATEPVMWSKWMDSGAFHADPNRVLNEGAKPYTILIPPPNVTAALHLGHALNNSIQDILIRAHRMKGFETLWMPGTDHAGIATQTMVDRKLKEAGKPGIADYKKKELSGENGREDFLKLVHDFKDEYEARITDQLQKMGCSCDWERQRFTMDDICARAVREAFFQLFRDGLIYRGKRLVNWDPVTQTALADDEVEMEDVEGFFWYMRYPVVDDAGNETGEHVTVATTRPETYLGDTGVAVNPKDPKHAKFIGKRVKLPFVGRIIPVIGDDYVVMADSESSDTKAKYASGFLKVTPAHDQNDWAIGLRHDLKVINIMAPDATISDQHGWERAENNEGGEQFIGMSREDARVAIEQAFRDANLLEAKKPYTHAVGHSYRSHAAIEPYLSDQWYCKVTDDKLRGNAQRALNPNQRTEASLKAWPESTPRTRGTGVPPVMTSDTSHPTLSKSSRNLPHWHQDGKSYFITFRSAQGEFSENEQSLILNACFHFHGDRHHTYIATVMPDHVHVILRPLESSPNDWHGLPDILHSIKSYTAHAINTLRNTTGPVWQDESYDRIIRDADEFDEKANYVFENPARAGLCSEACTYPFTLRDFQWEEHRRDACATDSSSTDGSMNFFPARYAKTYETWHDNLRDWCISRQLWWGHRIPVWHCRVDFTDENAPGGLCMESLDDVLEGHHMGNGCFAVAIDSATGESLSYDQIFPKNEDGTRGFCWDGVVDIYVCDISDQAQENWGKDTGSGLVFTQDPDVLDTWFSSALWPLSTMGWPNASAAKDSSGIADFESMLGAFNPTSVLTTAREIITLWVSRMTMFNRYFLQTTEPRGTGVPPVSSSSTSSDKEHRRDACATATGMPGPAPFKDVFIHAMIQDGEGRKMSKSLGNGVDPLDIIHSHGADAMRFTLCQMTTQTQDVRMPVEHDAKTGKNTSPKFDIGRNLCNKLWNASKFAMMMLEKNPVRAGLPIDPQELSLVDRWMLSRVVHATGAINAALKNYMFKDYADAIYDLLWRDFCDWYLESIKPTVENDPNQAAVLRLVLDAILRLMHPVTPFITESIHERLSTIPMREITGFNFDETRTNDTLCQSGWPAPDSTLRDEVAEVSYGRICALITLIREIRASNKVHAKRAVVLHVSGSLADDVARWSPLVETLGNIKQVTSDPAPESSAAFVFEGSEYRLSDLADAVDASVEKERLTKELEDLNKSIAGLEGRLSNPGYTDKAPEHLVNQTRAELEQKIQDRDSMKASLDKLG